MRTAIRPDQVRSLPVRVPPLPGETITGYLARLAHANALTPRHVRLHFTDISGLSPYHPKLDQAGIWAERLGGLPSGHFERDARRNAMYVRCHHHPVIGHPRSCRGERVSAAASGPQHKRIAICSSNWQR